MLVYKSTLCRLSSGLLKVLKTGIVPQKKRRPSLSRAPLKSERMKLSGI
jgi:hypothetical protein